MKPETVQKLLEACDEMSQQVGLKAYDDVQQFMQKQGPFIRFVVEFFDNLKTRPELISWLSKIEEPEPAFVDYMVRMFREFPMILGIAIRKAATSDKTPPGPKGPPRIDDKKRYEICQFVLDLHGKKRVKEPAAKKRAAQHFDVSIRSVDRIWNDREEIFKNAELGQEIAVRLREMLRRSSEVPSEAKGSETK